MGKKSIPGSGKYPSRLTLWHYLNTFSDIKSLQSLGEELKKADHRLVILEFYADWCEPCKAIGPKIEVGL